MNHIVTVFIPILFKVGVLYLCLRLPFKLDSDVAGALGTAGKFLYNNGIKKGGAVLGTGAYNLRKNRANKAGSDEGYKFDEAHKGDIDRLVALRLHSKKGADELQKRKNEAAEILEKNEDYQKETDHGKKNEMKKAITGNVVSKYEQEVRDKFTAGMAHKRAFAVENASKKYLDSRPGRYLAWGASIATLPLGIEEAIKVNLESLDKVAKKTSQKALLQGADASKWTDYAPLGHIIAATGTKKPKKEDYQVSEDATEEQKQAAWEQYKEALKQYDEKISNSKILTGATSWKPINRRYIQGEYGVMDYSSLILESDMKNYDDPLQVMRYWQQGHIQQKAIRNIQNSYKRATGGKEISDEEAATMMRRELVNDFLVNDEGKPMWRDSVYAQGMSPWDGMLFKSGFEKMYSLARIQSRYGGKERATQRRIEVEKWLDSYLAGRGEPTSDGNFAAGADSGSGSDGWGSYAGTPTGGTGGGRPMRTRPSGGFDEGFNTGELKLDDKASGLLKQIADQTKKSKDEGNFDSEASINHAIEQARASDISGDQTQSLQMKGQEQIKGLNTRLSRTFAKDSANPTEAMKKATEVTSKLEEASPQDVHLVADEMKKAHSGDPEVADMLDKYVNTRYAVEGGMANLPQVFSQEQIVQAILPKLKADPNLAKNLSGACNVVIKSKMGGHDALTVSPAEVESASALIATHLPGAVRQTTSDGKTTYNVSQNQAIEMSRAIVTANRI